MNIAHVADHAGVSIRTVSRVLNGSPLVNAATRTRVEAAIATLNFRPSARARGLATGRSYLLGVVHNDRNALVVDAVQRGIVAEAAMRGYELVVHPTPSGDDGTLADVMDFVGRSRVDGIIILPPVWAIGGLAAALVAAGVPTVALSSVPLDGFSAVMLSDERAAAAAVADHLLGLGHRHIAMVAGPSSVHSARERRAGFVDRLARDGIAVHGEVEGDYGFDAGVSAGLALLTAAASPTAIFAANDVMAAGVLKAAVRLSIAVPQHLSVVGFDGSILARMVTPALTTVYRPLGDMAQRATARVIDLIEGADCDGDMHAELTLVPGESSGPAPIA